METHDLRRESEAGQSPDDPLPEEDEDLEEEQEGGQDRDSARDRGGQYRSRPLKIKKKKSMIKHVTYRRPGSRFYGLFQLSDRIHCDSGKTPTLNLCKTNCSGEWATGSKGSGPPWWTWAGLTQDSGVSAAFTDDDINDDIRCFCLSRYWR